MRTNDFVIHNKPTIISDIEFRLLGLCMSNKFIMTIENVVINKDPQMGKKFYHMWDEGNLLNVHGEFYKKGIVE